MSELKKIYGIDLGTTYSAISIVNDHGEAEIIKNSDGDSITPSVVYIENPDNIVVGKVAKEQKSIFPEQAVEFVKRQMGDENAKFQILGQSYTPVEISSFILKRIVKDAEALRGEEIKDVVITCPAYFGEKERVATRQAGEMAGLNVVRILDEPVAAALAYGLNSMAGETKNILVYDLGGGTFDITVLHIENGEIRVVCTEGDHKLGGADWDQRLINYFVSEFERQLPDSAEGITDDPETKADLQQKAETVKHQLSKVETTKVAIVHNGEKLKLDITREIFDGLTQDLLEKTISMTDAVLQTAANLETPITHFDEFLLVGGSTRMPQVIEATKNRYGSQLGIEPRQFDPDEAVSKGAALFGYIEYVKGVVQKVVNESSNAGSTPNDAKVIQQAAAQLGLSSGKVEKLLTTKLVFAATKTYGIEVLDQNDPNKSMIENMIFRQEPLPYSYTQTFGTVVANQPAVNMKVYSSNTQDHSEKQIELYAGELIGEAILTIQAGLPMGAPIEVTFELQPDGTLKVTGKDLTGGNVLESEYKVGMDEAEVEAARKRVDGLKIT